MIRYCGECAHYRDNKNAPGTGICIRDLRSVISVYKKRMSCPEFLKKTPFEIMCEEAEKKDD